MDRGFRFYYSNIKFSQFVCDGLGTLIDGEIVYEESCFKFYVHDIICLGGNKNVAALCYKERMEHVTDLLRWHTFPPDSGFEYIVLLPKKIYPFRELAHLWKVVIPNLPHRSDGLILTSNELPHEGKKNRFLFKYKLPDDHTLDLQLGHMLHESAGEVLELQDYDDGLGPPHPAFQLLTWNTKKMIPFDKISMSPNRWMSIGISDPTKCEGVILECSYNEARNLWVPFTVRSDKLVPNDVITTRRTIETIMECLTVVELINLSKGRDIKGVQINY